MAIVIESRMSQSPSIRLSQVEASRGSRPKN